MISVAVYRVNKNRGYTVMANFHLRDKSLSLKAVGLLSKMLSFNDGWKFSTKGLSAICKEGPDAILSALRELEKHGYLVRHRQRDGKGRMSNTIFEIYEEPQESTPEREKPHTENPCVEKPDVDNPRGDKYAQINTDQVITQERNTLSKNYQSINLDGMDRMDEREQYRSCLELAAEYGLHSVAFCCISTGEFHFPNELAAQIAIQTVTDWQKQNANQMEVIFNVFKDSDYKIYERLLR